MVKRPIANPYNGGVCPICGKAGLKSPRQHINKAHKRYLTEEEYFEAMGIVDKECVICGRKGHEPSYKYDLCPGCLEEYGRKCPICGVDLVWHTATHFSRDHRCEVPEGMDELKLIKCNHCGKVLYPKRIPCGMREREYEAYCDDCLSGSFFCPSCGTRVFKGTFYLHLKSSQEESDKRKENNETLWDQFLRLMGEAGLDEEWNSEEVQAANEYNDLVKTKASYYNEWRTGKTFDEIYGEEKSKDIRGRISETMVKNGTGWSYWKNLTPEQKKKVVEKSRETRTERYGGWTSEVTHEAASKHIIKVNQGFYGGTKGYSRASKEVFDWFDELIPQYKTYHSENEWFVKLTREESEVLGQGMVRIDYYCPELSLIIEFNGDYWHANPALFEADQMVHDGMLAKEIWNRDRLREEIVKKKLEIENYFVLWETDYNDTLSDIEILLMNTK